jgi:hypothetical protein
VCQCVCASVYLSISQFVCLSVCPSIRIQKPESGNNKGECITKRWLSNDLIGQSRL